MSKLSGQHALVTGGGSGVGQTTALMLAEAGTKVTICGRRLEPLERVAADNVNIQCLTADVTDLSGMKAMVEKAAETYGPVTIAVANAGAADSIPFSKMDAADWQSSIDINLTGVFNTFKACLPGMEAVKSGRLISIASTAGLKGYAYVSHYCASKHGVVGLTKALSLELAKSGVTVNAICPGFVETPMLERSIENIQAKTGLSREEARAALVSSNPMGRFVQPEEVADAVLWLAGKGAASVTGQAISISGGEV
ncbi:SDR family NAD(P)-dependent oxidoreductase [Sneathiella limimaris]|uniref:SDR family NAD(P)-dependent oxidoreductase n=1 Tax=Sneathiella limimaris TaxID=1964213 RepID=UPI00146C8AD6|nr:SDR family NAD(P)-dependent oxidoreductase [Sneathiella limimaris]